MHRSWSKTSLIRITHLCSPLRLALALIGACVLGRCLLLAIPPSDRSFVGLCLLYPDRCDRLFLTWSINLSDALACRCRDRFCWYLAVVVSAQAMPHCRTPSAWSASFLYVALSVSVLTIAASAMRSPARSSSVLAASRADSALLAPCHQRKAAGRVRPALRRADFSERRFAKTVSNLTSLLCPFAHVCSCFHLLEQVRAAHFRWVLLPLVKIVRVSL